MVNPGVSVLGRGGQGGSGAGRTNGAAGSHAIANFIGNRLIIENNGIIAGGGGGMGIRGTSNDTTQSGKDATLTAFGLGGTNNYGGQGGDLGGAGVGKRVLLVFNTQAAQQVKLFPVQELFGKN